MAEGKSGSACRVDGEAIAANHAPQSTLAFVLSRYNLVDAVFHPRPIEQLFSNHGNLGDMDFWRDAASWRTRLFCLAALHARAAVRVAYRVLDRVLHDGAAVRLRLPYLAVHQQRGWAFLETHWYLTLFYVMPWVLLPVVAWRMSVASARM